MSIGYIRHVVCVEATFKKSDNFTEEFEEDLVDENEDVDSEEEIDFFD
jgi:hypothetical protein